MNYRMIGRSVGNLLLVEAACMLPSLLISMIYPESDEAFEKCGMRNAKWRGAAPAGKARETRQGDMMEVKVIFHGN